MPKVDTTILTFRHFTDRRMLLLLVDRRHIVQDTRWEIDIAGNWHRLSALLVLNDSH